MTIPRRSAMSWLTGRGPSATTAPRARLRAAAVAALAVLARAGYRIEVGQRPGQVPFTRSDLEKSGWKADLTIGAYTMFGGI